MGISPQPGSPHCPVSVCPLPLADGRIALFPVVKYNFLPYQLQPVGHGPALPSAKQIFMKKRNVKQLALSKTTIANLHPARLGSLLGGGTNACGTIICPTSPAVCQTQPVSGCGECFSELDCTTPSICPNNCGGEA
jgi:hypothetical protein